MKKRKKSIIVYYYLTAFLLFYSSHAHAQKMDSVPTMTLEQCIGYAMEHQPALNQAIINIAIAKTTNHIALSGWLPQLSAGGDLTHYYQLPTSFTNTSEGTAEAIKSGIYNTVTPALSASETLFTPQLLYAAKSASLYVFQAKQATDSSKINIVVSVSKSFYYLVQTLEQIDVLKEDTARDAKNLADAFHQYKGGIVDESDYQEAIITLNNSKAQLRQQLENEFPEYASLKQIIGFPPEKQFNISFDTAKMMRDLIYDSIPPLQFEKRIEYQQLQTAQKLLHQQTVYYDLAFLPTLSAFYNYVYEFENNAFPLLFNAAYPYSYIGLSLNIPLFTGLSRVENIHKSKLQEEVMDWNVFNLKSSINTQYATALGNYRSNLYDLSLLKDNAFQANNVYRIVTLQYRQGIVAYLNVIVAESNLITAEIGYINAIFQTLSSKIDLQKALGAVPYKSLTQ